MSAKQSTKQSIVVAVTGASGAVYAEKLIRTLLVAGKDVTVVITEPARLVIEHELGVSLPERDQQAAVDGWLTAGLEDEGGSETPGGPGWLRVADVHDLLDPICSGTHLTEAMVVVPCSMATVSGIACGRADDLALRAADVMLKERRPLILVPRETPLSLIHLRNMVTVTEAGAVVVPAMPGFYNEPETIDDLVDHVVAKTLDQLGVTHGLSRRWGD